MIKTEFTFFCFFWFEQFFSLLEIFLFDQWKSFAPLFLFSDFGYFDFVFFLQKQKNHHHHLLLLIFLSFEDHQCQLNQVLVLSFLISYLLYSFLFVRLLLVKIFFQSFQSICVSQNMRLMLVFENGPFPFSKD